MEIRRGRNTCQENGPEGGRVGGGGKEESLAAKRGKGKTTKMRWEILITLWTPQECMRERSSLEPGYAEGGSGVKGKAVGRKGGVGRGWGWCKNLG